MMIIKIEWIRLIREHCWLGWIYFGAEDQGNPFAKENRIYWQFYKEDLREWITKAIKVK